MAIPRVFHQIWINDRKPELPEQFRKYRDGWLARHPAWKYYLWNLHNLPFQPRNADVLAQMKDNNVNYAQMSDLLRYEILYEFGGVYLDTDFECLRPIDEILEGVHNFTCSEDGRSLSVGILGAEPSSALMLRCIENFPRRPVGVENQAYETGPGFFTQVVLRYGFHNNLTVFPSQCFYPYSWNEPHRANEVFPQAYGVHRWAYSWKSKSSGIIFRIWRRLRRLLGNTGSHK